MAEAQNENVEVTVQEELVTAFDVNQNSNADDRHSKISKIVYSETPTNMPSKVVVIRSNPVVIQTVDIEEEKLKKRLERFKSPEENKLKVRAARFGISTPEIEAEKMELRAAKFGLKKEVAEDDKLKKRAARFGVQDPEAIKKARLERFKPLSPTFKTVGIATKPTK